MKGLKLALMDEALLQAFGRLDRQTVALNAADCAERVLPLFERCHPDDLRPRNAIDAARAAARAAGHAAASAHVARHAIAVVSYSAIAAGHAAYNSEYRWQRTHLLEKRNVQEIR